MKTLFKLYLVKEEIMIKIQGKKICLRTFTREEYHQYWKSYVADSVMDPDIYVYDKERVDKNYDSITEKESWYLRVGIFLLEGTPIGTLSFKRINYEKSQCELGIVVATAYNDGFEFVAKGSSLRRRAATHLFALLPQAQRRLKSKTL